MWLWSRYGLDQILKRLDISAIGLISCDKCKETGNLSSVHSSDTVCVLIHRDLDLSA